MIADVLVGFFRDLVGLEGGNYVVSVCFLHILGSKTIVNRGKTG